MNINAYLKNKDRELFAQRIGTTKNYVNNLCQFAAIPGRKLALKIEQETGGEVTLRELLFPCKESQEKVKG